MTPEQALEKVRHMQKRIEPVLGDFRKKYEAGISDAQGHLSDLHKEEEKLRAKHLKLGKKLVATMASGVELTKGFFLESDEYDKMTIRLHQLIQEQQVMEEMVAGAQMGQPLINEETE